MGRMLVSNSVKSSRLWSCKVTSFKTRSLSPSFSSRICAP
jgi:uncharacterized membrane-anchored protein